MYVESEPSAGQKPTLAVSPDQLLPLANGLETERNRLRTWLRTNSDGLVDIDPPGSDLCSRDTVVVFAEKGRESVKHAKAYVEQLTTVVDELRACAREYGLVEDNNTDSFSKGLE